MGLRLSEYRLSLLAKSSSTPKITTKKTTLSKVISKLNDNMQG